MGTDSETLDTFPKLLMHHARVRPAKPAIREKDLGIWQTWTWGRLADEVRALACGLAAQGLGRGDHIALVGDNRPRLYAAMCAAQCLGAIPVPLYQDAAAAEMAFPIHNAQITHAVAEDQEQVDKLLEILPQCPTLKHIYYDDPRGMRRYTQQQVASYEDLLKTNTDPSFLETEIAKGRGEDSAAMLFTSGTTGTAKGVVLTHHALIDRARVAAEMERLGDDDVVLAYLPPAWVGQFIFSYAQPFVTGYCICCPESAETVMTDMREVGPTYYFAPPRVLEALLTQVSIRMEDAAGPKRWLYRRFMAIANRAGGALLDGKPVSVADRILYFFGNLIVYGPLRNVLGMSRVRVAYTAGEAIGPDLFRFYRSLGINLKQLYGSTETAVFVCIQPDGQVKPDTVGPAVPGVELKFTPQRELLIRSPGLFKEYYKNPQATSEAKDAEGWFHTGDAGYVDPDGHLKIIDRVKDVGQLADGTLFAPKYLENKLKFFPYIREAVAFGHGRERVCAFINFDIDAVANWAEKRNMPYSGYTDLASRDEVYDLVRECIERVNADLAGEPELARSQITRFLILHKELDADDGELTRTRKVRRGHIAERYAPLVQALYDGSREVHVEAQVKYEDGRSGTFSSDLKIRDAQTFPDRARQEGGMILSVENVSLSFGGVKALQDVTFDVEEHEVRAIIGPNGAGKSSMLNVLNGVYHPQQGKIRFRQKEFADMDPHVAASMGIARTFQNIALFKGMTVLDNLMTGRNLKMRCGFLQQALWLGPAKREELAHRRAVEQIIDFLEIQHIRKTPVGRLPYGLQKRVELGRALAAEPALLLLDEPMAGMNLEEKQDMCRFILDVNDHYGTTLVLIEHDMGVVMDISDRVVVLDYGRKIADGSPEEIKNDKSVIDAYLGVAH